ncbi:hypothetical protein FSARC_13980 [Fusarium sarcochroum]|uniref:Uncharacterized protein n=1 Tax=Fusarium sarcochroum TaxID=1208366 RepID=A0A8H4WRP1_9HYPO|nr:hypothetical protein FSARC_13980 [Fusarium sarcochroum]
MNFWHEYALPLSQSSKPVKAAICALGGAHKSFKIQDQTEGTTQSLANSYELASVQQYNSAIRIIREYMSSPDKNFQVILTCCLIFICTESLYGRHENVSRHLEAAFSLLSTRDRWNDLGTECHNETSTRTKQGDLAKFMENISPSLCSLASDLFFYVGDNHSPKLVSELTKWVEIQDPINLEDPGTPFASAQDAASSLTRVESMCDVELYTECPTCLAEDGCCGNASLVCRHINNELDAEPYYHHWNARFNAFKKTFDPSKASDLELYRFKILELEEATWAATLKLEDMEDDLEMDDCINMLQKAESIIQFLKTDKGQTFTFQANLVPPIAYVIISCQDANIQWKGVELLRSLGRREGVWDSKKMADIYAEMITAKEKRLLTWDEIPADVPQLTKLLSSLQLSTP